jgi:hypothetical protein
VGRATSGRLVEMALWNEKSRQLSHFLSISVLSVLVKTEEDGCI